MFLLNSCLSLFSAACHRQATLIPKLRVHFAEFLNNASPAGLRILSSSTCVGLRYGRLQGNSGFSRQGFQVLPYFHFVPLPSGIMLRYFSYASLPVRPGLPFPAYPIPLCPHSSACSRCRNLNLLSIGYAVTPRLRPRLPQGRSALPWNPWIFGLKDSHLHLATHSGILSSQRSAALFSTVSTPCECSPTDRAYP